MLWCHCRHIVMFRHLAMTSWTEFLPRYKVEFMMKPSHFKSNNAQSFGDYLLLFSKRIQTNSLFTYVNSKILMPVVLAHWMHRSITSLLTCSVSFSSISKTTYSNESVWQLSLMLAPRGHSTACVEDIILMCGQVLMFGELLITHSHYWQT